MLTLKERINHIQKCLDECFPNPPVPLDHKDPFTLLLAVLLSAQCTDERVNQVTPKLFALADNPLSMSKITQDKIYTIIKPCGLGPQKSRAIKELSLILTNEFKGEVPEPRSNVRSGSIEGSCCLPFNQLINKGNNTFKSIHDLDQIFNKIINTQDNNIVFSCGSGVTASVLALAYSLINTKYMPTIYDGSWSEYGLIK